MYVDVVRSMVALRNSELQKSNPSRVVSSASCSLSNIPPATDRRPVHPSSVPTIHHPHPASEATDDATQRAMSWSTSDVEGAPSAGFRDACQSQVPVPAPNAPAQQWSSSLTRGSTLSPADDRLGVWASSLPSIPRECGTSGDSHEPAISTRDWLDALHRGKGAFPASRSTDQMEAVCLNPAGYPYSVGSLGRRPPPSRSTLAGSSESFASAVSRQSLTSRESVSSRSESAASKKRRVRFELQPPAPTSAVQRVPDQRHLRSRSDRRQKAASLEDAETRTSTGSLLSKFRRVVVDGVGSLFGLSKPKSNVDEAADVQPTSNGHLSSNSFDNMSEMERLAVVADRVASERLHSAVLHGKLPASDSGTRGGQRLYGGRQPSSELDSMESVFAGVSISTAKQPQHAPAAKPQDLASWCTNGSSSVSAELDRLPSNACSSYVQFLPKSETVPCSVGAASNAGCRKPSASSSMGNVVMIECHCGSGPVTGFEPLLPATNDASRVTNNHETAHHFGKSNCNPYAEPSSVLSPSQTVTMNGQGHVGHTSATAASKQEVEIRASTSNATVAKGKPQPPPKVSQRSSATSFREGLLPAGSSGVEDFRIRRQTGNTNHGSRCGPMKATVPFLRQPKDGLSFDEIPAPPQRPPTRSFADATAANCAALSSELDVEAAPEMSLQELSALVDRELQANRRLELTPEADETVARCGTDVSTSRVVSSSVNSSWSPAVQSKDDVEAQLKSLGFDEDIWNLDLDGVLDGNSANASDDDDDDSASTLTDCSGSVVTVTATPPGSRRSNLRENDQTASNDVVNAISGRGSVNSLRSVQNGGPPKPLLLGSGSSHSLPLITDALGARSVGGDPAHPRCSSTNIPVPARTCRDDARGGRRLPVAFSFNQLLSSGTTAAVVCSPYNSKSSGIGSMSDSGSMPSSPM